MPPLKRPGSSHKIPNWVQRIWNGFRRSGAVNSRRLTSTSSYDGIAGDARNDLNAAHLGEHSHEFIYLLAIRGIHYKVQGVLRFCAHGSLDVDAQFAGVVTVEVGKKHFPHIGVPCWT